MQSSYPPPSPLHSYTVYVQEEFGQCIFIYISVLELKRCIIYKAVMLYNGGFCKGRVTKQGIMFNSALPNMRVT